jgi:P27 family predicted phage terminase small subunit
VRPNARSRQGTLAPPDWLDSGARAVWETIAPLLDLQGRLDAGDANAFAVYCDACARHREAAEMVARDGMLIVGDKEQIVRNPAVGLVKEYGALVVSSGRRFGL